MEEMWHDGVTLTAATDGGLKSPIGSHGYILYLTSVTTNDEFIPFSLDADDIQ